MFRKQFFQDTHSALTFTHFGNVFVLRMIIYFNIATRIPIHSAFIAKLTNSDLQAVFWWINWYTVFSIMLFTLLLFLLQTTATCDVILPSLDTIVSKSVVWSGTFTPIILIHSNANIYRKPLTKMSISIREKMSLTKKNYLNPLLIDFDWKKKKFNNLLQKYAVFIFTC